MTHHTLNPTTEFPATSPWTARKFLELHEGPAFFISRVWIDTDTPKCLAIEANKIHQSPALIAWSAGALEVLDQDAFCALFDLTGYGRTVRNIVRPLIQHRRPLWLLHRVNGAPMICHSETAFAKGMQALCATCETFNDVDALALANADGIARCTADTQEVITGILAARHGRARQTAKLTELAS